MDLVLCHQTADFDTLGAAVGLTRLKPGARLILTGGTHPGVKEFLAFYRDKLAVSERRSIHPDRIRTLAAVDAQTRDRFGPVAEWFDLPNLSAVEVYDHHLDVTSDLPATLRVVEPVGATATLIAERLRAQNILPTPVEATAMALGIHADTGSLTFEQTTLRDARSLTWLLEQGASISAIAAFLQPALSPPLQQLLATALKTLQTDAVAGRQLAWVLLAGDAFIPGLSRVAEQLFDLTESDALLLGYRYRRGDRNKLILIGRSRRDAADMGALLTGFGGGGHPQAASATLSDIAPQTTFDDALSQLHALVPHPPTARELMSAPVRTIRPETPIADAQRILLRYGHSGLSVVDASDRLVGIISRRDLDLALHHGFEHAPVKGYMSRNLKTIAPDVPLPEIESLMVTYDIGRLPVLNRGELVGIVTRTDVLRQRQHDRAVGSPARQSPTNACLLPNLCDRLAPKLWDMLQGAATAASDRGWHLYLVGGAVRDVLLAEDGRPLQLEDIDLVVDGFHNAATVGAGVELANVIRDGFPGARLDVHGTFQTAALLWSARSDLGPLCVDIATARTEFYPYPAANPEVEASSIRQDLYRRDFTINALALRLSAPRAGELLDFFGGYLDLRAGLIRVLHANSFIEDPTRIYRAVRFAVRLHFELESQTVDYIHYAIASGAYERSRSERERAPALQTRLKAELKYILQAPYWRPAAHLLADLDAWRCLHPDLVLTAELWWQVRYLDRCLHRLDRDNQLDRWRLRLEAIVAALPHRDRLDVAAALQLPADSQERLSTLNAAEPAIATVLSKDSPPSTIVVALRRYQQPLLLLVLARAPKLLRRRLWQYLAHWSHIRPLLDGNDLRARGYKPGPQYREILDALLAAYLDGKLANRAAAEHWLEQHYPLNAR
ncbi:tRNA nucleotidyltransferase/poly(A) polymerase [Rubidibacter lacunae KORDI 51-2]|uniref:tRNA nucleotidyltransferase/poly(A) polymerase n=1 Tax=Rubidibacter lacunae KORDI 51-2 TaxID=582515 RepID=U5DM30_9CHRO|nr:CBS domain-containing protein [Rubidibacter lacunae]ERN40775.1 tRNA nucleotidyltransferase/poly(A) polymerase [Rubidibacter lacunae KORDI 51-2]